MLVTPGVADTIAWGIGLTLAAAGIAGAGVMLKRQRLPLAAPFVLLALLGLLFAVSRQGHGTRVVIAKMSAGQVTRTDLRLYGSASYSLANNQTAALDWLDGRSIVVNDTPQPMILETLRYGMGASSEAELAPFKNIAIGGPLEYFGPDVRPPTETTTASGVAEKYWLRW